MPLTCVECILIGNYIHPEELNNITLVDRLNQLETRMSSLQLNLDAVVADNMDFRDKLPDISSNAL